MIAIEVQGGVYHCDYDGRAKGAGFAEGAP